MTMVLLVSIIIFLFFFNFNNLFLVKQKLLSLYLPLVNSVIINTKQVVLYFCECIKHIKLQHRLDKDKYWQFNFKNRFMTS